jgi:hypothetical protein
MTGIRGLLALFGLAAGAAELRAQVVIGPNPYLGGTGVVYASHGRHASFALGISGYWGNPFWNSPYGYNAINQVTVVYAPPPVTTTTVILPPPVLGSRIVRLDDLGTLDPELRADAPRVPDRAPPPAPAPAPAPMPPLPGGRDAGVFRPLAPDNRDKAAKPVVPEPKGELPRPAPPEADPKAEAARQLKVGREAHAAREYGRAAQRFREAARQTPDDALPYLLLGQSLFAAGRYAEAVEAIRAGVTLRPDWPDARFAPRELYGDNAAEFNDHLRRLREALDMLPDDPVLLFLYAYQLWFDGRQEEARPLFRRARPGVPDPAVIDRFLAARPVL